MDKETRNVAIAVFTDGKKVVVQDRKRHSRVGEKYGFWGGEIENSESPEEAIRRELKEEMGFVPDKLDYWDKFSYEVQEDCKYKGWLITFFVFVSPITERLKKAQTTEGKGIIEMDIERVYKGEAFPAGSTEFLKDFNRHGS